MDTGQEEKTHDDGGRRSGGAKGNPKNNTSKEKAKTCGGGQSAKGSADADEGKKWRGATGSVLGRGGQAKARGAWGRGVEVKAAGRGRGSANGWGGRGGHGRQDVKKLPMGRNQVHDAAEKGEGRQVEAAKGVTRGAGARSSKSPGPMKAPRSRGLNFKTLLELCEKEPSVVAITLSSHPALKTVLSTTGMKQEPTELLCRVITKAFKSQSNRSTLQHLADLLKDSAFLRSNLPFYLAGIGSDSNSTRRAQYPQHLDNILSILSEVLSIFPASSVQTVGMLVTLLQASISNLKKLDVPIQPELEEKAESLQALIGQLQERSREGTLRSDKAPLPAEDDDPDEDQQNFRTIPIYPTVEEFHQVQRPFLRRNHTNRRYTNTHIYLDTHFRLLREDFVRPLREGIQKLLQDQMDRGRDDHLLKKHFDDIRVYFNTNIIEPKCTKTGLAYIVTFDIQPLKFVCWENSKRLIYGSLVCLSSDNFESFLFATVSDRNPQDLKKGKVEIMFTEESRAQLARVEQHEVFLMVETTAYFEAYRYVLEGLQELQERDLPFQRYIVECNKEVEPPAYLREKDVYDLSFVAEPCYKTKMRRFSSLVPKAWPPMKALGLDESQMRAFQLALTKELAIIQGPPGTGKTYVGLKIAQALLTNRGLWSSRANSGPMLVVCYTNHALDQFLEGIQKFLGSGIVRVGGRSSSELLKKFNLRELTHGPEFRQSLPHQLQNAYNDVYKELCNMEREVQTHTAKLKCSLKGVLRETVLMKFMSPRHWRSLHLRPTLGYFRTQFQEPDMMMEWLGVSSNFFLQRETENEEDADPASDEEMQQDFIAIQEEADWIQAERIIEEWSVGPKGGRDAGKESMKEALREMEEQMLTMNLHDAGMQAEQSEEEFQFQKAQKKKMKRVIQKELRETSAMTEEEELNVLDVWGLSQQDRWRLYRLWMRRFRMEIRSKAEECGEAFQNVADRLADIKRQENLRVLKGATVIGMTTTGAAKCRRALQEIRPRLVIVEEAAEVLEAHIITTLSRECQHLILIGDHQQLRPSATVYDLAKNFNLEMSMFERLVKMEVPFVRLDYQHRMRSEIARLLTPHIYSELENHPSVLDFENIKGLDANLFFVEHNHLEEMIKDGKSHQNEHEANFVVALCRYLLLQEYKPDQITILTTYSGQLHQLRRLMPASEFSGVKVHVVDKYQGEENDIVLLSLVRSNLQGNVGFLSIPNRVCVALSRAKKGLYCIGNSKILGNIKLWDNIFQTLRQNKQIGTALTLCCQNHPDAKAAVSCAEDFKKAPEGGCTKPCLFRLDCGHVCASVCHPYDAEHKNYKCMKPCQKTLCDQGHLCKRRCYEECPNPCEVKVEKIVPRCQHTQMIPCHQDPGTFSCRMKVTLELECGHSQKSQCFNQTRKEMIECTTPCKHQLKCGHACQGTCGKCNQGRFHYPCYHPCERILICSHKCREPCTRNCPPCQMPCENCCVHSKCMKKCGEACAPCVEPCAWQCQHQSCSKLCHEPCDRPPCTQPCEKTLDCGHPCIGLCGDKCPNKCRVCDREEVTEIFFGTEDEADAYFIQLEDCGHIIEHTAMDQYMKLDDDDQATEGQEVAIKLKECPKCRTPIRKNLRYGSSINRRLADIEMVKGKINGHQPDLEEYRETLLKRLEENGEFLAHHPEQDVMHIKENLEKSKLSRNDLWLLENRTDFLIRLGKLLNTPMLSSHASSFKLKVAETVHFLRRHQQKFTEQQVSDLQRELQRLHLLAELNACCNMANCRKETDKIDCDEQRIRGVLEMAGQFSEQDERVVKEALKNLQKKFPLTGLRISEEDRKMIVSAMQMRPGHWHKCPNGHIYVITECGGAMESRKCPDCSATIGGQNHRLDSGNAVASEMDGAQHSAWSEVNNLQNFGRFI